jgi:hypothetical protein
MDESRDQQKAILSAAPVDWKRVKTEGNPTAKTKKSGQGCAIGCVVILSLLVVGGIGLSQISWPSSSTPSVGDEVLIEEEGLATIIVARDIETFNELTDSAVAGDDIGYAAAALAGGFVVPSGTRALVIDLGFGRTRVRILSGEYLGEVGWVPSEWLKKR